MSNAALFDRTPGRAPLVTVEWVDICASETPTLALRWTVGFLLAVDYMSEGLPCVVTATTWDEDGWTEFDTYPSACVMNLDEMKEALDNATND